jgi:tetratricopeptide (TPR) repeat protein
MNELDLFAAAVAITDPGERADLLDRECAGRPDLRQRIDQLLDAHFQAHPLLDRTGDPELTGAYVPNEQAGTIIAGRYKLLEKIGEGGMGTVWVAEQSQPVRRKVAVKLIKAGMDSKSVVARFEAERQALALMDHPNVAKVLDGGLTETNRPFFVMEYVKGVPITEYCDATRLSVPERLQLFTQVCKAVQHAHQKGIIHRDLKPSNILVAPYDDKPVPKIIDFGLAKAMHQSLTEKTLHTAHETVIGTPLYMSPEQAQLNNLDVDTRSDIYSLGVLLYELLTGTTPLEKARFKKAAWDEIRRIIRDEEPPSPSKRLSSTDTLPSLAVGRHTEPLRLTRMIRGELDWIVMKALEKDRTRRYDTANGFARDIECFLNNEPVAAGPPSAHYRMRKFVKRNRGQVIAASLILFALLAGIVGTTWGLFQAAKANADLRAANRRVEQRYDLAVDAIKTFHTGVSEDFLLKQDQFKDLRDRLLKSASDFYGKLGALLGRESDIDSRRALLQANFEVANLTGTVGRQEDALAAHRAVLLARETMAGEPGADHTTTVDVGRSLAAVASIQRQIGKTDESLATYRKAMSLLGGPEGFQTTAERAFLADCHTGLGLLLYDRGDPAEAEAEHRRAMAIAQKLVDEHPGAAEFLGRLAQCHLNLAAMVWRQDRLLEADSEYRRALTVYRKLAHDHPAVTDYRKRLADSQHLLGSLLKGTGKMSEADAELRAAQTIRRRLVDDYPAVTEFRKCLADSHLERSSLMFTLRRPAEEEAERREGVALYGRLVDDHPTVTEFRQNLADSHDALAGALSRAGKPAEAEAEYRLAMTLFQRLADDVPAVTKYRLYAVLMHDRLGAMLMKLDKSTEAAAQYRLAITLFQKLVDDHPAVTDFRQGLAESHNALGSLLAKAGEPADAEGEFRLAIASFRKLADDHPDVTYFGRTLSLVHSKLGELLSPKDKPAAEAEHRRALAITQKLADDHPGEHVFSFTLAENHLALGGLMLETARPAEAEAEYHRALAITQKLADDHPGATDFGSRLAGSHDSLGDLLSKTGRPAEAEAEYRKALAIRQKVTQADPLVAAFSSGLAGSHTRLGLLLRCDAKKAAEAGAELRQALAILEKLAAEFPAVPEYHVDLGGSYCNVGILVRDGDKPSESLKLFDKAIRILAPIHEREPHNVTAREFLRNSYRSRAEAHDRLHQFVEAIPDWDRAIELSRREERPIFRAYRATAQVNAGQVANGVAAIAEAVAEVAELTKSPNCNADQWYNFACVYAVASGKIAGQKDKYARRAIELLQRAVKAGYKDAANMKKDTDLDSLRRREDFKKLLAEMGTPAENK